MAWFKYLKSTESINSSTTNSNYSYPYCKRFIGRFTPRDTLEANTWIFASILDININTYKDTSLENQTDETSYVVTYEKGDNVYPVETVIEGNYLYFKTHEIHTAAEEIVGQYAVYYNTPNLRKINEVDNGGVEDYQVNLAPVWEDLELAPFVYGESYLDGPSAIGTVYSISSGALPTGLSINSSTGQITGTVNSSGAYSFTARATTDDGKYYNEASFSGTVYEYPEWVDYTLANINYNTAYSDSVWADGYPTATYSISSGELPSGITLNSATGLVSGTTLDSGAYSFTIKAENAIGSISQSFSGTVQSPPSWSDQTLGAIIQGVSYSDGVSATGTATIVYSVYSGSLPSGLSLNSSTGVITGTTGSTGSYNFTIRATNSWGHTSKAFTGTIYTAPAWTDSTIANMIYGQAYSDAVAASGYPAVTYSISAGVLPSGITLNSSTGAITGTSTTAGSYSFTVKAENAVSNVTQLFTDDLYVTPAWTDNTLVAFTYNTAYSNQVVATGTPTYTVSSGTLPTGLSLNTLTLNIGDTGPGGGKVFITPSTAGNSTGKYFEAAPVAVEVTRTWATGGNQSAVVSGADGTVIGTGAQNTIDIVNQAGNVEATSAAVYCSELDFGGKSDWFLPSKDELQALWTSKNIIGGFSNYTYWSSSEADASNAWTTVFFPDGHPDDGLQQSDSSKSGSPKVRPIRSFSVNEVITGTPAYGAIAGIPTYYGAYSFTIQAANETGSVTQSFSGAIDRTPSWTDSTLASINYNIAYSDSVAAIGYPTPTYSVTTGTLPTGLSLNSSSGAVTGTSTQSGSYSFTIRAENTAGNVTQSFSGTIQSPPSWSDQALGAITQGVAYSDGVSATGTATIVYSVYSGSLPTGLSLNTSSGAITGTTGSTGSYSFTIRATNTWGYAEKAFTEGIYTAPAWTDSTIANMIYGQVYSDAVAASGYPAVTYSISAGALPSGITLNSSTGAITGTSTTAGSYSFTIRAENAVSNVTQSFTDSLFVTPSWTDQTLAAFTYNTAYSDQVVATGTPTYTISSGTLPTGLSFNKAPTNSSTFNIGDIGPGGGKIFITPSTAGNSTGKYFEVAPVGVEVQRTWATGENQSALVSGADALAIGTGAQNTIDIVAQAGNVAASSAAVYCSELVSGGYSDWFLPSKDELAQIFTNRVALGNDFSPQNYWSSSEGVVVYAWLNPPAWLQDFVYGYQSNDNKDMPLYVRPVRAFDEVVVPGALTGTPTYYGAYSFTIQAANETGSVTQSFSGAINKAPTWDDETLADALYNTAYSDSLSTLSYPVATFSVTSGSLPTGLTLSSSGTLSGTSTATGNHSFTITATNSEGSISKSFSFNVNRAPSWSDETLGNITQGVAYSDGVSAVGTATIVYSVYSGFGAFNIGDTGPGGGKIFITPSTAGNSTGKYFEVAPVSTQVQRYWSSPPNNTSVAVSGADALAIGTGEQNTAEIVAQSGNVAASSAAVYCSELVSGGQSDWFLPSKDELTKIYTNRVALGNDFGAGYFWSSSESSYGGAYARYFTNGTDTDLSKANNFYVRPVRAFDGLLPTGLSLNTSTGAITGTASSTESYNFVIRATNDYGYAEKAFAEAVYTAPLWTDSTIASIIYGEVYSDAVAASGYPAVTYSISSGALPTGISLNTSTGAVTGTSTQSGSYSFTIRAENAVSNVTQSFTWSPFTFSGGTSYNAGTGYTGVYFNANGTFTISSGTRDIEYLVLSGGSGGGGGGGNTARNNLGGGAGGAAGNYVTGVLASRGVGSYPIVVGGGGVCGYNSYGSNASFTYAGGSGATGGFSRISDSFSALVNSAGPTGGAGGYGGPTGASGGNGSSNTHYSGGSGGSGSGSSNILRAGGGGAGDGGNGSNASSNFPTSGGSSITLNIYPFEVGVGGGGASSSNKGTTTIVYGGGGGGGASSSTGDTAFSGLVVLRWLT